MNTFPVMPAVEPTLFAMTPEPTPTNIPVRALDPVDQVLYQALVASADYVPFTRMETEWVHPVDVLRAKSTWREKDYREAYAEAAVEQGIAWQVRINRERRGMSQAQLAAKVGTRQSAISRMEDPEYGSHSLPQLLKVAHAFDCALIVKLAAYSTLAIESHKLAEDDLFVLGYDQEIQED